MVEIFDKMEGLKIAVCGDFCLDIYWELDPAGSEISVETGLEGQAVKSQRYSPGGAGNVVANLAALKPAKITAIGVIGRDIFARELRLQLSSLGVDTKYLIEQEVDFATYAYCKRILEGKELERIDFGFLNLRKEETDEYLLEILPDIISHHDALIFNQQIPQSITNDFFIEKLNDIFQKFQDKIIVVDSRNFGHRFENVFLKLNDAELAGMNGIQFSLGQHLKLADVEVMTKQLFEQTNRSIFVTRGERGMAIFDGKWFAEIPGVEIWGRIDPVGAGDTVVSALACSLAAGASPKEAAELANLAAAVTVRKLYRTGTASPHEILHLAEGVNYIYQLELAENRQSARYFPESQIEICCDEEILSKAKIQFAIFDHDGTISTLRQGWEKVMEPMMIKAILGARIDSVDDATKQRVRDSVQDYIAKSTGIQTILQMEALVELVREFGFVAPDEIKTKFEYKEIYNNELLKIVNERLHRLKKGELSSLDFTIKGIIPFLKKLRELGVVLYLFSGTDEADVIAEAEILGYADLFNGGIYGSLNDVRKFSKNIIIQKILSENNLHGSKLAVFGDGPVEMQESRRHKGIAIGVASDEVHRHGLNEKKRARLIRAGAHLVIADFAEWEKLIKILW